VPRWLLLHHEEWFSVSELADAVGLSVAVVSRVVRALEEAALVRDARADPGRGRRALRLERPHALLEAWLPAWQRRRVREHRWDIGAREADEALDLLREAGVEHKAWTVGGLAGAAAIRRAVEPVDVLVWTTADEVAAFAAALHPEPTRGGRGAVRVAVAPDPWTLTLARVVEGLPVSDPVQLWLDCSTEGERALEAADAVADATGWS
jgi:DNA-binding transcriptional ArsR family regulator